MFEYKDAIYFTSYFNEHPDFKVIEEFKESDGDEEKNLYVGFVEVLNTVHPLQLRVEIPKAFPHQKLTFRTKSLSGYPHLIHTGKIEHGDWFCLNTPFAETAEEQLNQEVIRLKEWLDRCQQILENYPPIIKDYNVIDALRRAYVYEWENVDEVNEFKGDAYLTFVGDFADDLNYFKEKMGYLHCVKTPDNRFYALHNTNLTNFELPYIIVDEDPKSIKSLIDFIALRDQYDWDENVCEHLLPGFDLSKTWTVSDSQTISGSDKIYSLEEALTIISKVKEELQKEESYLFADKGFSLKKNNKKPTKLLSKQKELLLENLQQLEEEIKQDGEYIPLSMRVFRTKTRTEDMSEEERAEQERRDAETYYYIEEYPYEFHYFALGIRKKNNISWLILYTNHAARETDYITFDIQLRDCTLCKLITHDLWFQEAQVIDQRMFFGRGMFSNNFQNKKIALVGLGAIGSIVAESLARSGVTILGLWDNDTIEPGNICRSTYTLPDLGKSKVDALANNILSINPYVKIKNIKNNGYWLHDVNSAVYIGGSFYNNINYDNQEDSLKRIQEFDMIIDCTGSNEMLHFLSYAVPDKEVISLCITNHSNDLLCVTNRNFNPFELRKAYLSRIEQDTKNFYMEGAGCYSPTFIATNSDIASLVNLVLREMNISIGQGGQMGSMVLSHDSRGILVDRIESYKLEGYDIKMAIPSETILDAEEMNDAPDGAIGYILGCYSKDGKQIMVTHVVEATMAKSLLTDAYETSKGIIDYIGDFAYSGEHAGTFSNNIFEMLAAKAEDENINTNNPLLAVRNPDGSVSFFLFINNELEPFVKED